MTATVDLDEDNLGTVSASSGGEAVHDSAAACARQDILDGARAAIPGGATMSLTPPRPSMAPPLNGTTGSAVPCTSSTETGRDGAHGNAVPNDPATGAMAETMSARSHASRAAMNAPADIPVAKTRPRSMP